MKKSNKPKKPFLQRLLPVLSCILTILGALAFFSAAWYIRTYGKTGFDSVLFTLTGGLNGVQDGLVTSYIIGGLLPAVLFIIVVQALLFFPGEEFRLCIPVSGKKLQMFPFPMWLASLLSLVLSLVLLYSAGTSVGMFEYLKSHGTTGQIYEKEYVDPATAQISFPEEKRNLVYIMLESMETSYLSEDLGGALPYNLIPELYDLAAENMNFSHNKGIGGLVELPGVSWTIGSMVGQTSGIPLKVPDGIIDWQNGYGKDGTFLPGLTSLNSILRENGYYQALMVGSDADFGGRETYYSTHGVDEIYDIYTARADGIIPKDYFVWWGMEDKYLFEYAKQEITEIAARDQPFNFTMLTVDTHHVGGYRCEYCDSTYEENYENVISCSSRQVYEFVQWLMQQDFYDNTTVVITGDHCSMDNGYFTRNVAGNYTRHVYNCFLNAAAEPGRTENRQFSALDMFPTTLAALGCQIEGDRLGLGANLFSDQPTLMERVGYASLCSELANRTAFYANKFYAKEK